tara:strand:+ start:139 stop:681 length:543 start_codon:yes stop_codon:yes gene_type:complete
MAYFLMLPDGTTGTNEWQTNGAATPQAAVTSDDDQTSYIYETRQGHEITLTMANPGVAEETIDFDEDISLRAFTTAHYDHGSGTVDMDIQVTGTGIMLAAATVNVAVDNSYPSYVGLTNMYKSLGSDWDYTALENSQIYLECTSRPDRFSSLRVSYAFIRVDYTAIVVAADNATFFGANF